MIINVMFKLKKLPDSCGYSRRSIIGANVLNGLCVFDCSLTESLTPTRASTWRRTWRGTTATWRWSCRRTSTRRPAETAWGSTSITTATSPPWPRNAVGKPRPSSLWSPSHFLPSVRTYRHQTSSPSTATWRFTGRTQRLGWRCTVKLGAAFSFIFSVLSISTPPGIIIGYYSHGTKDVPPTTQASTLCDRNLPDRETGAAPIMDWNLVKSSLAKRLSPTNFETAFRWVAVPTPRPRATLWKYPAAVSSFSRALLTHALFFPLAASLPLGITGLVLPATRLWPTRYKRISLITAWPPGTMNTLWRFRTRQQLATSLFSRMQARKSAHEHSCLTAPPRMWR